MSSFTEDGSMQEGRGYDRQRPEAWSASSAYAPEKPSGSPTADSGDRDAMVMLARAIELEIIPRLMLAHRAAGECITLPGLAVQEVSAQDVQSFAKLVLAPDEDVARSCVEAMRTRGFSVETIYLDLLAPVARYLGELWEQDLCDFTEVTLGLGRLQQVLRELSPAFSQANDRPANGRRILLLPSPGEQHTFGLAMVAEFFRRAGWDVAGGPWEAGADPVVMVKREWFDVIGFSLGGEFHLPELAECIRSVRKAALNPAIGIMVGGPMCVANPELQAHVGADLAVTDGRQAPELAEKLVAERGQYPRSISGLPT